MVLEVLGYKLSPNKLIDMQGLKRQKIPFLTEIPKDSELKTGLKARFLVTPSLYNNKKMVRV